MLLGSIWPQFFWLLKDLVKEYGAIYVIVVALENVVQRTYLALFSSGHFAPLQLVMKMTLITNILPRYSQDISC